MINGVLIKNIRVHAKSIRDLFIFTPEVQKRIHKVNNYGPFLPPFMITSSGSAGSHLLGILLDSHPIIGVGPEVYLLNKREIYQDYLTFQNNLQKWLMEGLPTDGPVQTKRFFTPVGNYFWDDRMLPILAHETSNIRQFLDVFFGHFLLKRQKKMWGEKLPENVNCIGEFLDIYSKGRIIHLIRDGRDVAYSLSKRKISISIASETWLHSNAYAMQWNNDPRFLLIKYEDLVSNPNDTLARIQNHLGVEKEDLIKLRESNNYWHKVVGSENNNIHRQWEHNPLFSPISTSSIGSYQNKINKIDLEFFLNFKASQCSVPFPRNSILSVQEMMDFFGYK